jgi:hypothetical protein
VSENDIGLLPTPLLLKRRAAELLAEAAVAEQAEASDALIRLARTLLAHASQLRTAAAEEPDGTIGAGTRPSE